jgi:hypothetical protein
MTYKYSFSATPTFKLSLSKGAIMFEVYMDKTIEITLICSAHGHDLKGSLCRRFTGEIWEIEVDPCIECLKEVKSES